MGMDVDDVCLILNPNASKGRGKASADVIIKAFKARGCTIRTCLTKAPGDALSIAEEAKEGLVVVAGGDGTVNEVLNGIMRSGARTAMGVIPIGRGNDFAWAAGIPRDIKAAVDLVLDSDARPIDVGYLEGGIFPGGRFFLNGTGFGFEPMINFQASRYKHINGMPSYIMAFFHCLINIPRPYDLVMTIDGEEIHVQSQQVSVCNGRRMGSAFILAPDAWMDDGYLDIVYAKRPVTRHELIPLTAAFFKGSQLEDCPFMTSRRGREVIIRSSGQDMSVHTDGEFVSLDADCVKLRVLPGALRLHYVRAGFHRNRGKS